MRKLKLKKIEPNKLSYTELRDKLRESSKTICSVDKCKKIATDIHHLDENHSNNEPENLVLVCKIHHNEVHDITPIIDELGMLIRTYYRIQDVRKMTNSQILAYENLNFPVNNLQPVKENIENTEKELEKQIKKAVKEHPFWKKAKEVKGLSHILFANLVSEIGDPRRFNNPSKLWKYFGLHTEDGVAVKRKKGSCLGFALRRRSLAWKIADSFNKVRNTGNMGKLLAEYHKYYTERDGEKITKGHILNRAKRKAIKLFLCLFWSEWMKTLGEKPTEPFVKDKLEHKNLKTWKDIIS